MRTVQFANGATGRGLFANRNFDDKEFLLTYWAPRSTTKTSHFDYVMELQEGKQVVFVDTSEEKNSRLARFINDKDRAVAANCLMKKVTDDQGRNHCIFLATRSTQSGLFHCFTRQEAVWDTESEAYHVPVKNGSISHQVLIKA